MLDGNINLGNVTTSFLGCHISQLFKRKMIPTTSSLFRGTKSAWDEQTEKYDKDQCDQIWRNFATLSKF